MGKLLIGFIFILLDFVLEFAGGRTLDMTPDMIGYLLVIFGLREMIRYSHKFAGAYKVAFFGVIASGAVFGVNLITGQDSMSMTIVLVGIAELALQVLLMIFVASGLAEMEAEFGVDFRSKWLKIVAICVGAGIVLGYAGLIVPTLEMVGSLVADIASFGYLILFYFAWESFKAWREKEE